MPDVPDSKTDIKEIRVAGCRVKLSFQSVEHGKWMVEGTVTCGSDDDAAQQSV